MFDVTLPFSPPASNDSIAAAQGSLMFPGRKAEFFREYASPGGTKCRQSAVANGSNSRLREFFRILRNDPLDNTGKLYYPVAQP